MVTFSGGVTLLTPGDQLLTVTDTSDEAITVSSGNAPRSQWAVAKPAPLGTVPAGPVQVPPSSRNEPAHRAVVAADRVYAALHQGDSTELPVFRMKPDDRREVDAWLADLFSAEDLRLV